MKRIIFSYYNIFKYNKLSFNAHTLNLFKNHQRNILQYNVRNYQLSSTASNKKNETQNELLELIYQAPQMKMVARMRLSTLSIGAFAIIAQPFLITKLLTTQNPILYVIEGGTGLLLVVPFLLHLFTRGYVYEILYDDAKKTYVAKLNNFFLRPQYVTFKIEDIQPTDSTFTSFYVKGKPLIVFEESFTDVSHFIKMKGYDKPLDIKLETLSKHISQKNKQFKD